MEVRNILEAEWHSVCILPAGRAAAPWGEAPLHYVPPQDPLENRRGAAQGGASPEETGWGGGASPEDAGWGGGASPEDAGWGEGLHQKRQGGGEGIEDGGCLRVVSWQQRLSGWHWMGEWQRWMGEWVAFEVFVFVGGGGGGQCGCPICWVATAAETTPADMKARPLADPLPL